MKNNVNKGFLFYLIVFLAVIVGVACIFATIMIVSPGVSIFGYKYGSNKEDYEYYMINKSNITGNDSDASTNLYIQDCLEDGTIETINVATNYADVIFDTKTSANFAIEINSSSTGIQKEEYSSKTSLTFEYDKTDKALNISVEEPTYTLPFNKNIRVVIAVPQLRDGAVTNMLPESVQDSFNLNIKTNNGSVNIGSSSSYMYCLNDLNIQSRNSKIILNKYVVIKGDLNINNTKGEIQISTKDNEFNGIMSPSTFKVVTESAKINIGSFKTDFTLLSKSSIVNIAALEGDMLYAATKGVISIGTLKGELVCEEEVVISNFSIDTLIGCINLPNASSSDVTINNLYSTSNSLIRTEKGDVKINNLQGNIVVNTQNGNVEVSCAKTKSDTIICPFGTFDVTTTKGNVDCKILYAAAYVKDCKITTISGDVKTTISQNQNLTIKYKCKNAPTFEDSYQQNQTDVENGYKQLIVGSESTNGKLIVLNSDGKTNFYKA